MGGIDLVSLILPLTYCSGLLSPERNLSSDLSKGNHAWEIERQPMNEMLVSRQ